MIAKTNKRKDFNEVAFAIGQIATGEIVPVPESEAVKSGRKGGLKGGKARANRLTALQRSKIASDAAKKRWGN